MNEFPSSFWIGTILVLFGIYVGVIVGIWLIARIVVGAALILAYASENGFVGVVLYFVLWVIALPLMLIACAIIGHLKSALDN